MLGQSHILSPVSDPPLGTETFIWGSCPPTGLGDKLEGRVQMLEVEVGGSAGGISDGCEVDSTRSPNISRTLTCPLGRVQYISLKSTLSFREDGETKPGLAAVPHCAIIQRVNT
ncbi:hypothetical protein XENOCAPTIV_022652 [Xenoophorus captivus]|uniref:Uncharacterized protein n=1 Tax=Xenoophorus captivus TaxID=1517983 RepID=A0ABV0S1X2_9TELE